MITLLITRLHKIALLCFVAFVCLSQANLTAHAQTPDFEIPQPTGNAVNDFAGVMNEQAKQSLENILINLKKEQKIEFAVVTVKTTGGRDIFDYALAIGRGWGVGPSQDEKQGLLLLVAVDDRKYHTLVSRHLQGELPDGTVGTIQRQYLVPAFRAGDYSGGLTATVRAYIDTLAQKRGFSTAGIYQGNEAQTRRTPPPRNTKAKGGISICGLVVIVAIILIVLAVSRGRGGGGGGGCLNMLLLGSLFSSFGRGGGSSGGWGGGGFGGSSGGGGGGFGGFGGGGDFDGGGSGGSW
ncbi:MAG: TPM domain-containing protein [Pyrinomonadaceae bacterium]|nr:TPM domain-containing protein [Pyrinomonadaceae bacterium]